MNSDSSLREHIAINVYTFIFETIYTLVLKFSIAMYEPEILTVLREGSAGFDSCKL